MTARQSIEIPITQENWNNLPQEFNEFLDTLDEVRQVFASKQTVDPLYPSYDYEWEMDSTIALDTAAYYWNSDEELPSPEIIINEINEAFAEAAYDDWVSSAYSF